MWDNVLKSKNWKKWKLNQVLSNPCVKILTWLNHTIQGSVWNDAMSHERKAKHRYKLSHVVPEVIGNQVKWITIDFSKRTFVMFTDLIHHGEMVFEGKIYNTYQLLVNWSCDKFVRTIFCFARPECAHGGSDEKEKGAVTAGVDWHKCQSPFPAIISRYLENWQDTQALYDWT